MRKFTDCSWLAALGLSVMLAGVGVANTANAANAAENARQKRAAEAKRATLQKKLGTIKRDIHQTESAKGHAADALAHSEQAISEANRSLHELAQERQKTEAKIALLSGQQANLNATVRNRKAQLAQVLREQYVSGNEDRIKLLLSGENPNQINRTLQYMAYVSQAQAKLIETLRSNLQAVEANKAETQLAKDELDEIAVKTSNQKAVLESEKGRHATLLSQLSSKLAAQRTEAGNIQRDEQRLAGLLDKLTQQIERQKKAAAAAAEKRRQQQLARAKAKREKHKAKKTSKGKSRPQDAIDDDVAPSESLARNELTPEASVESLVGGRPFSSLRGQLRLPVRGELSSKFGSKRGDGPNWKGLFIRTAEGAEIKAVAAGRVIFSDWLRGFGNLIIIDHGSQYMTIYGNNQAVLKRTGDLVKTGDVIASAGNSGGNEQSGLYFEMRHKGRAFDPLDWVAGRSGLK